MTANFSYIYQWLLSNISDFTKWTKQVMDKVKQHEVYSKLARRTPKQPFLLLALNKFILVLED